MDYAKEIEDLKKKIHEANSNYIANDEQLLREIKNEILLKQTQVNQLQKELDAANSDNFGLIRQLDKIKSELKECEFNRQLSIKKQHNLEAKLKEINEKHMKLSVNDKLHIAEIDTLTRENGMLLTAKYQLSHEVAELKEKLKYLSVFQHELEEKQTIINKELTKIKESEIKLEAAHAETTALHKELQKHQDSINMTDILTKSNLQLKKKVTQLENLLAEKSSKLEKLQSLMFAHRYSSPPQQDIITRIKYLQLENRCKELEEKNEIMAASYGLLDETLQKEIEANAQLIIKCEELEGQNGSD